MSRVSRVVVGAMRKAVGTVKPPDENDEVRFWTSRSYGHRRYFLDYVCLDHSGLAASFDADTRELWVHPDLGGLEELQRLRSMGHPVGRLGADPQYAAYTAVQMPTMIPHQGVSGYGYCVVCGRKPSNKGYKWNDCPGKWY